jgi:hypothetical protein
MRALAQGSPFDTGFNVVTEWTPLPADKARKEVNKRRRHFNMSKTGFVSQMGNDATKTNPRDVLVDESKQADIENLGDFSLTIVLYGRSRADLDQLVAEFTGVFTNADGNLFAETYNQLNAYFGFDDCQVLRAEMWGGLHSLCQDAVQFAIIPSTRKLLSRYFETVLGPQRDSFKCHCRL